MDLGLDRAGWRCAWQCEIDDYRRAVLEQQWPSVPRFRDVREIPLDELPPVDLVCGGFPCQPVSTAGLRRGAADPRWLWPAMARVVRGIRPRFVLLENTPGLLLDGMGAVLGDLAGLGYDAEWQAVPACAFGAPHLRYRIFIVAYHPRERQSHLGPLADAGGVARGLQPGRLRPEEPEAVAARPGLAGVPGLPASVGWEEGPLVFPAASPEYPAALRTDRWTAQPGVCGVAHGVPDRMDRIAACGEAVLPQVAEWIGRRLMEVAR